MSATIGTFYERVSRAIKRGTVYDDDIPGYAADAVRELEDETNWKYMWVEGSGSLVIDDNTLTLERVKSVRFIKFVADDGSRVPVKKAHYEDVTSITSKRPGAYWMQTRDIIGFDESPDKTYDYIIGYFQFSDSPLVSSLAWLTLAEDLLIARTIKKMYLLIRDDKLAARCASIEAARMPALLESEVVSEFDGEDNRTIPFLEEMEEDMLVDLTFTP